MDTVPHGVSDTFNAKNTEVHMALGNAPDIREKIEQIEQRADQVKEKLQRHCDKHWTIWVKREQHRIVAQNNNDKPTLDYSPWKQWKTGVSQQERHAYNTARETVNNRIHARMQTVDNAVSRMKQPLVKQAVARYHERLLPDRLPQQSPRDIVKEETASATRRATQARANLFRHFEKHKSRWIENAKTQGFAQPEREAYVRFKSRNNAITEAKDKLVRQTHEKNGVVYEEQKQSLTQVFNQRM